MNVRPFVRTDREQLVDLAGAHAGAAMPGATIPAATLLSQLERPIGEPIVGSWVAEQATLVCIHRDRVVAAAHLWRYTDDERADESLRNCGQIVWLLCWPGDLDAGRAVRDAALGKLAKWQVRPWYGDGALPVAGVYGVSDHWPHIQRLYHEAGFRADEGQVEVVFAGSLDGFPRPTEPPVPGLELRREVGPLGTAFNATLGDEVVGTFEVCTDLTGGGTNVALAGWADEANHWVREDLRGRGIGTWLVSHAGSWMRLGRVTRFLAYAIEGDGFDRCKLYYARYGLQPINRTVRGWRLDPQ